MSDSANAGDGGADGTATGAPTDAGTAVGTDDPEIRELAAESDPVLEHDAEGERYLIRRLREGDVEGFLRLHRDTPTLRLGGSREWFEWKFEDPPGMAHPPVFVAEHEGDVVGARPFLSFRLRAGPRTAIGLQTADTMVHPDHRSRGLFSRMNDLAFEYYRRREPNLMFSVPNARSRPAYLDMGARVVGPVRNHLRIETPSAFAADKLPTRAADRTGSLLDGLTGGYLRLRDRGRNGRADGVDVERRASIPADTLAEIADRTLPEQIHARRDRAFYEWRFANPNWEYDAFVAARDGEPIAALVAGTRDLDGRTTTRIAEVVPLAGEDRFPGVAAALERLLETRIETDVFTFAGTGLPSEFLSSFGFHPDDGTLLSAVANPTVLISMPLTRGEPDWTVEGRDVSDPGSWQLPYCEQNTG